MIGRLRREAVPSVRRSRYDINHFKGVDADTPEDSLSINYCSYGYNIRLYGGELSQSFGVGDARYTAGGNEVELPLLDIQGQKIRRMHHYVRYDRATGETQDELIVFGTLHHYFRCPLTHTGEFTYFLGVHNDSDETDFINYLLNYEWDFEEANTVYDDEIKLAEKEASKSPMQYLVDKIIEDDNPYILTTRYVLKVADSERINISTRSLGIYLKKRFGERKHKKISGIQYWYYAVREQNEEDFTKIESELMVQENKFMR